MSDLQIVVGGCLNSHQQLRTTQTRLNNLLLASDCVFGLILQPDTSFMLDPGTASSLQSWLRA